MNLSYYRIICLHLLFINFIGPSLPPPDPSLFSQASPLGSRLSEDLEISHRDEYRSRTRSRSPPSAYTVRVNRSVALHIFRVSGVQIDPVYGMNEHIG